MHGSHAVTRKGACISVHFARFTVCECVRCSE
jgi:hypothetical protein